MLLCYITDRRQFPGDAAARRRRLLDKIAEASRAGVNLIQLRERDLPAHDLESLARDAVDAVRQNPLCSGSSAMAGLGAFRRSATRILINSRADIALASGADGVHLRSDDISPAEVRALWRKVAVHAAKAEGSGVAPAPETGNRQLETPSHCLISVACHSVSDVELARAQGADIALFAPVFEKSGAPGVGLTALRDACRVVAGASMPVLALGGVTLANARACLQAGAAGIAAIRLFQENDVAEVVAALRALAETETRN